jgi:cell division protein FtsW
MMKTYTYDDSNLKVFKETERVSLSPFMFVCIIIALVGYGLLTLYSASYDEALRNGLPPAYYFIRQTVFALLGFVALVAIRFIPLLWIRKGIPLFLICSLLLMILTLVTPFGIERLGARRWLQIGPLPSFQPSELLKVSVILYLSHILSKPKDELGADWMTLLISAIVVLLSAMLIVLQRDYSTTLVFLLVALALLLAGGVKLRYLGMFSVGIGIPAVIFLLIEPYRIRRVVSFLFPSIDPTGLNWQVLNSLKAISAGGLFGKGLGNGTYKLGTIPEVQSDFIFASLAEEMGFVGILVFFILFAGFAILGFRTASHHLARSRKFTALASFGLTFMIVWQALVNLAVVTSLLPPTGIPLPFFSQGGTNLFMILCECGLLYKFMVAHEKEMERNG